MRLHVAVILVCFACVGCGTTKWTDTTRTATEQLLLSDSMDRAVSRIDFRSIAGKKVFLDATPIASTTDNAYLASLIRQHMLASGAILKEKREEADYVVELRAGAVGTDRHDLLFGVPAITLPVTPLPGIPSQIPEIPLIKRTDQRAVSKISVFVYNRNTGRIVWQSGVVPEESRAKAVWFLGAGPFQRGSIYDGTKFAGDRLNIPLIDFSAALGTEGSPVSVAEEAYFVEPRSDQQMADKMSTNPNPPAPATSQGPASAAQAQPSSTEGKGQAMPASGSGSKTESGQQNPAPGGAVVPAGYTSSGEGQLSPTSAVGPIESPPTQPPNRETQRVPNGITGASAPLDAQDRGPSTVRPLPPVDSSEREFPLMDPWPYYRR